MSNSILRIRVFATLVIVAYHCACPYYMWQWAGYAGDINKAKTIVDFVFLRGLSNTMLPTFFMISGMLFYSYKEHYSDKLKTFWKKFDRLIVPYCLMYTLIMCLRLPNIGVSSASGHLWFVRDLFIMFAFSILFYKIKERWLLLIGVLTYSLYIIKAKIGFETNEIVEHLLNYYIFFIGGGFVQRNYSLLRKKVMAISMIGMWLLTFALGIQTLYTFFFNFMLLALMNDSEVKSRILKSLNRSSFGIYLLHHVVIFALFYIPWMYNMYVHNAILAFSLMFVLSLSISWFIMFCLVKIGFKYF